MIRRHHEDSGQSRWFTPSLLAITVGAFVLRYVHLVTSKVDHNDVFLQGDAAWYSSTTWNASKGKWFVNAFNGLPTADHAPGTVIALWPTSWFGETTTFKQRVMMVIIGTAVVAVIGLAGRVIAGPICGVVAAFVAAVNPNLWVNDVLIMSETPTAFTIALLLLAVFLAYRYRQQPNPRILWVAAGLGVLSAAAALTRAEAGLMLPLVVWPVFLTDRSRPWKGRLLGVAIATLALALTLAPWTLYNSARFQSSVLISTNDGLTLMCSNVDETWYGTIKGSWTVEPCVPDFDRTIDSRKGPLLPGQDQVVCDHPSQHRAPCWDASVLSKEMRGDALHYIRTHLHDLPSVEWARHGRVWGWYKPDQAKASYLEGRPLWTVWPSWWFLWIGLPISVAGAVVARRRRIPISPFLGTLASVLFITTFFYGLFRFRVPFDVSMCLLIGLAATAAIQRSLDGPDGPFLAEAGRDVATEEDPEETAAANETEDTDR